MKRKISIVEHFGELRDPRREHKKLHPLTDVLIIALCAVICGADSWRQVEAFGIAKRRWLSRFLQLPNDIPSHDTFRRVFILLNPRHFEECFVAWMNAACTSSGLIPIHVDGKAFRRSRHKTDDGWCPALHSVSAWTGANHLTLGQVLVDGKSNEITAIPELLKVLDLKGCIVTIDAMGCQKDIAQQIVDDGGDYVLALKENQPTLYKEVEAAFEVAIDNNFKGSKQDTYTTEEKGHGRDETRTYLAIHNPKNLPSKDEWANLRALVMVIRETLTGKKYSCETHYYISSAHLRGQQWASVIRGHWSIENNLHWVLDVAFLEDKDRTKDRNAARNLALVRRIALSLLKRASTQESIICERKFAGWSDEHLEKILQLLSTEDVAGTPIRRPGHLNDMD
jgi:predicted transposase YbfD/YdcC